MVEKKKNVLRKEFQLIFLIFEGFREDIRSEGFFGIYLENLHTSTNWSIQEDKSLSETTKFQKQ